LWGIVLKGGNVLDIPRNRREDEAAQALCDHIIDTLDKVSGFDDLMPEQQELLCDAVYKLCGEAYHDGYLEGRADENRAVFYLEQMQKKKS
jgi:hypothetical protein